MGTKRRKGSEPDYRQFDPNGYEVLLLSDASVRKELDTLVVGINGSRPYSGFGGRMLVASQRTEDEEDDGDLVHMIEHISDKDE